MAALTKGQAATRTRWSSHCTNRTWKCDDLKAQRCVCHSAMGWDLGFGVLLIRHAQIMSSRSTCRTPSKAIPAGVWDQQDSCVSTPKTHTAWRNTGSAVAGQQALTHGTAPATSGCTPHGRRARTAACGQAPRPASSSSTPSASAAGRPWPPSSACAPPTCSGPPGGTSRASASASPSRCRSCGCLAPVQPQPLSHLMQRLLPLPLCRLSLACRRLLVRQAYRACRTLPNNRCSPYGHGLLGRRLQASLGGLLLQATSLVVISAAVCMPAWCRQPSLCWCGGHGRPAHSAVPVHALNLSGSCILHQHGDRDAQSEREQPQHHISSARGDSPSPDAALRPGCTI